MTEDPDQMELPIIGGMSDEPTVTISTPGKPPVTLTQSQFAKVARAKPKKGPRA